MNRGPLFFIAFIALATVLTALNACGQILGIGEPSGALDGGVDAPPPGDASDAGTDGDATIARPDTGPANGRDANDGDAGDASPPSTLKLALGWKHSCVLLPDGLVECWGDNSLGQLGMGGVAVNGGVPHRVPGLAHVVWIASGPEAKGTCAALEDGAVVCWGGNSSDELGVDTADAAVTTPTKVPLPPLSAMAIGDWGSCGVLADRSAVQCWGYWRWGGPPALPPVAIADAGASVVSIAAGATLNCAANDEGGVACWGHNQLKGLAMADEGAASSSGVAIPGVADAVQVAVGARHACALRRDGYVMCWGENHAGETGARNTGEQPVAPPVVVPSLDDVAEIAAGVWFTCARKHDGTVWCWGYRDVGSNPQPLGADTYIPQRVNGVAKATSIAAGTWHVCAVVDRTRVQCWGWNDSGQIGNGGTATAFSPQDVSLDPNQDGGPAPVRFGCDDGNFCTVGVDRCCTVNAQVPDFCFGGPGEKAACVVDIDASTTSVECDSRFDCDAWGKPGQVCCARDRAYDPQGFLKYSVVECVPEAECAGPNDVLFCQPGIDGGCPTGKTCAASDGPPYLYCR